MIRLPLFDSRHANVLQKLKWRIHRFRPLTEEQYLWLESRGITVKFDIAHNESWLLLTDEDTLIFILAFPEVINKCKLPYDE